MERLEQYCREHSWKVSCEMCCGPRLVLSKGRHEISKYLVIGMDLNGMIREMEFIDNFQVAYESQFEFIF